MLRLFLSLILAVSFFGSFSAKAETELWGDYSGAVSYTHLRAHET